MLNDLYKLLKKKGFKVELTWKGLEFLTDTIHHSVRIVSVSPHHVFVIANSPRSRCTVNIRFANRHEVEEFAIKLAKIADALDYKVGFPVETFRSIVYTINPRLTLKMEIDCHSI